MAMKKWCMRDVVLFSEANFSLSITFARSREDFPTQ
jgi:hypothetical protein